MKISLPQEKRRNYDALYNPMTIKELQNKYPYLQWLKYLNGILEPYVNLSEDEIVNVRVPSFFEELGNLLAKTPKRTQANYVISQVVRTISNDMGEKVQDIIGKFYSLRSGTSIKEQRWDKCVSDVSILRLAISALYVRSYVDDSVKQSAIEMFNNITLSFKNTLKKVNKCL